MKKFILPLILILTGCSSWPCQDFNVIEVFTDNYVILVDKNVTKDEMKCIAAEIHNGNDYYTGFFFYYDADEYKKNNNHTDNCVIGIIYHDNKDGDYQKDKYGKNYATIEPIP